MTAGLKNSIRTCKPSNLDGCCGELVYANWRLGPFPVKKLETMLIRHGIKPGVSPRKSRRGYHGHQVDRIIRTVFSGFLVIAGDTVPNKSGEVLYTIHEAEVDPITNESRTTQVEWIKWNGKTRKLVFQFDSPRTREVLKQVAAYSPTINTTTSKRFQVSLWTDYCRGVPFTKFDAGQYKHVYFIPRGYAACVDAVQAMMEDTANRYTDTFAGLLRFPVKKDVALVPSLDRELASQLRRRLKPVVDYVRRRATDPATFYSDDDANWEVRRWQLEREYDVLTEYENAFHYSFDAASYIVDGVSLVYTKSHLKFNNQREAMRVAVAKNPDYRTPNGRKPRFLGERAASHPHPPNRG